MQHFYGRERSLPMRGMLLLLGLLLVGGGCRRPVPVDEVSLGDAASAAALPDPVLAATDWPSWRGPTHNGISVSPTAPTEWSDSQNVTWSAEVPGRGHGSPVIVGDKVFLASALDDKQQQILLAYDKSDGAKAWEAVVHDGNFPSRGEVHKKGTNANSTVASDGEKVFIAFLNAGAITVSAYSLDGQPAWRQEVGKFQSKFGYAPSPLVYKSFVIIAADNGGGGYLAALDRATGEIRWRKKRDNISSYSSPMIAPVNGRDQLLISGCHAVTSYDPSTGEQLWSTPGTAEGTCGTVATSGDLVFASGGFPERQTICVKGDGSGEVWSVKDMVYEPSLIVVGDCLFGVADNGVAYCWDAATGKQHWRERVGGGFSASPVLCNGLVYVPNLAGETLVLKVGAEKLETVAKNRLGDDTYASPAICDGKIYLRVGVGQDGDRQEKLYCVGSP